jgi:N-methylhydantoinase A
LDTSLAEKAIAEKVAVPSGLTVIEAAAGIIDLAEQQIQHAIERVSYERGIDARRFTLVGAGGAGALHLTAVARAIGASKAFVPKLAGVFCAFGLCNSDVRLDLIKSINAQLDQHSESSLLAAFKQQSSIASKRLTEEGFDTKRQRLETFVDLKYLGQSSTLSIPVDTRHLDYRELARQFEVQFDALYGHHQPDGIIELQNLRLAAYGVLDPVELATVAPRRGAPKPVEMRKVYSSHTRKFVKTAVYNGRDLHPGNRLPGPAMVEEVSTTVMAGPLDTITIDNYGNYLISTGLEGAQ